MTTRTEGVHEGGCLCGEVRYRTRGAPLNTNVCHCTFCQRFTGTAFLVEPVFEKQQFELLGGSPRSYEHLSDNSGMPLRLYFCGRCGTTIALDFDRFPSRQGVCGGTYDDPNWFRPTRHIFTRSARRDTVFPPGIDLFDKHAIDLEGRPETPWHA